MKKLVLALCISAFLFLGGGADITTTNITHAESLQDLLDSAGAGKIPDGIIEYEQGRAEGKSGGGDIYTGRGEDSLSFIGMFYKMLDYLSLMIASIAITLIVINGLRITYSAGGEELNKAKSGLLWSCLGLAMITFSYVTVKSVVSLTFYYELTAENVSEATDEALQNANRNNLDLETIEAIDIEMSNRGL